MPTPSHKIEIFKSYLGENWGNVYIVSAGSMEAAVSALAVIYDHEEALHSVSVNFDYARVSTWAAGDSSYTTVPLNSPGEFEQTGNLMPLFVTARVDIQVIGGGRPSRKFYRGVLDEPAVNFNVLDGTRRAQITTNVQDMIDDLKTLGAPLVDPDGQVLNTASTFNGPQMRQLHRKRRPAAS